jgi:tRNA nucleotidyltransferase (CCA-adding enzyme)
MHRGVVTVGELLTIAEGLRELRKKKARVLAVVGTRSTGAVTIETLRRAAELGLKQAPISDVTWWGIPALAGRTSEVTVRRALMAGTPLLFVRDGRSVIGCIEKLPELGHRGSTLLGPRMDARCAPSLANFLRHAGLLAESKGIRLFAVGGLVRDLLLDRPVLDVDLAVEGDALSFARLLAERENGRLTLHEQFRTASLEGVTSGRIDVAETRRETYSRPGALPSVSRATIEEDLARRDFTVNAMAIYLNPGSFGLLLDPQGGWRDLTHRVIRALHPLSFIEDPTRIFRALRYAVRLEFGIEQTTLRLLRSALGRAPYPSLSGQRLLKELELAASEPDPALFMTRLGRLGLFRLIVPGYRFASIIVMRLGEIQRAMQWSQSNRFSFNWLELILLALTERLNQTMAREFLERLSIRGEPAQRLLRCLRDIDDLLAGNLASCSVSELVRRLDLLPLTCLGWLWVRATRKVREKVEWFLLEGRLTRPLLNGDDLQALGVLPGPRLGDFLSRLRSARLERTLSTREEEEALVKKWLAEMT